MTTPPPPLPAPHTLAFFLDLDGTLFEIRERPEAVVAEPEVTALLTALEEALEGALAVVSGRPLASIDELTRCARLPAAGLHGYERRDHTGVLHRLAVRRDATEALAQRLAESLLPSMPGLQIEDKGIARALHYRQRPSLAETVMDEARKLIEGLEDSYVLQPGKMVVEIKPRGADKGTALASFMAEPPFRGRFPVMVGDDLTDESAFAAAQRLGGLGLRVGRLILDDGTPSQAGHALPSVSALRTWLGGFVQAPAR